MKLENVRYYNIRITTIKEGRKEVPVGAGATLNIRKNVGYCWLRNVS